MCGVALRRRLGVMNVARRYPRFRRLLASLAVSQAGDWLYNLALLAFVYERTHSSTWLAITTAARVLPSSSSARSAASSPTATTAGG